MIELLVILGVAAILIPVCLVLTMYGTYKNYGMKMSLWQYLRWDGQGDIYDQEKEDAEPPAR